MGDVAKTRPYQPTNRFPLETKRTFDIQEEPGESCTSQRQGVSTILFGLEVEVCPEVGPLSGTGSDVVTGETGVLGDVCKVCQLGYSSPPASAHISRKEWSLSWSNAHTEKRDLESYREHW